MLWRTLLQTICLALPAAAVPITQPTLVQAASEECRAKPDLSAQMGNGHWHYRIDRINQRRCWFLSSGDSRVQHISSLRRRVLINRSTEPGIEEQSKPDGRMRPGPTPIQDPIVASGDSMYGEFAAFEHDAEPSESLVPRKVTTISFVQPRVAEQSAGRRTNFDLVFFCGVLATALLFAGGVVLLIDRFHRSARTASPKPVPLFKVRGSQNNALSSKRTNLEKLTQYSRHSNITSGPRRETLLRYPQLH